MVQLFALVRIWPRLCETLPINQREWRSWTLSLLLVRLQVRLQLSLPRRRCVRNQGSRAQLRIGIFAFQFRFGIHLVVLIIKLPFEIFNLQSGLF